MAIGRRNLLKIGLIVVVCSDKVGLEEESNLSSLAKWKQNEGSSNCRGRNYIFRKMFLVDRELYYKPSRSICPLTRIVACLKNK